MKLEYQILDFPLDDLEGVDTLFYRHAQLNVGKVSNKYRHIVEYTKNIAEENMKPRAVICSTKILNNDGIAVEVEGNFKMEGQFISELLRDATDVVWYAVTLPGFPKLIDKITDILEQFFFDAWGSAIVSAAGNYVTGYIRQILYSEGLYCTPSWVPGQHGFDIKNQKICFDILKPERIGIRLNDSMLMSPSKSTTGIIGIVNKKDNRKLVPCTYCNLKEKCPSAFMMVNSHCKGMVED